MNNVAFACPYCGKPGISAAAKLISSAAMWWGWSATCRFCRQRSRISGKVTTLQFGILMVALATIPWFLDGDARVAAAYLVAALILVVGMFAPMTKDLTS